MEFICIVIVHIKYISILSIHTQHTCIPTHYTLTTHTYPYSTKSRHVYTHTLHTHLHCLHTHSAHVHHTCTQTHTHTNIHTLPALQIHIHTIQDKVTDVVSRLSKCAPLVFAGEVRTLQEELAKAALGQGFLLMVSGKKVLQMRIFFCCFVMFLVLFLGLYNV